MGTLDLTVKCTAQAYGVVKLQGRATPIDAGTVTLMELGTPAFPPVTVTFNASTGAWAAGPFEVQPGRVELPVRCGARPLPGQPEGWGDDSAACDVGPIGQLQRRHDHAAGR